MQNAYTCELALDVALASTRMEGFEVTEQTRLDCQRLMDGQVSVSELAREIADRSAKKAG